MPIQRILISPPKEMTKESVREVAEKMLAALKGIDADSPLEKPQQAQDTAQSTGVVQLNDQDEGEMLDDNDGEDTENG